MKEIAIDTSFYIDLVSGVVAVKDIIEHVDRIYVSPIVIGEVLCGLKGRSNRAELARRLDDFCFAPGVEIVALTMKTAEHYAQICAYLREQGTPIPTNDLWIAASAMEHGLALATNDRHFSKIPHLMLI